MVNTASCASVPLPVSEPGAPSLIHLLPIGDIRGRDGRGWRLSNPETFIAATMKAGVDLPIDYEHQSEDHAQQKSGPVPAAGWIKALEIREGGIWGKVEWTATAAELIGAKSYRYISPVFTFNASTGEALRLVSAGLVHRPNLELKALSAEESLVSDPNAELRQIAAALGVEDATTAGILSAINAVRQPDPAQYVPIAAVRELLADRNGKIALMSEREAEANVDAAVLGGYITPGLRGWATALCRQDPESFAEFMKAPPAWAHMQKPIVTSRHPPAPGSYVASAEAEAICAQLGLDPSALGV